MASLVDNWLATGLSATSATVRVVRNAVPTTVTGTLRHRSNRVHSSATETLKQVLMANMQQHDDTHDPETHEPVRKRPMVELPASSSPYAIRLAYLSGSMLNAASSQLKYAEFDRRIDDWELDLGASDVARFDDKVRTMITGVTAALIGRKTDRRFERMKSLGIDVAIACGIINPLTNLGDGLEFRESIFASVLEPDSATVVPPFVDKAYDEEAKEYTGLVMQTLSEVNAERERDRKELLVSDKAFNLSQSKEFQFEHAVFDAFNAVETQSRTLIKLEVHQPSEGEEYTIEEVSSVGGIPTQEGFSLGNGVSFVVECAEIARTYLESLKPQEGKNPATYGRSYESTDHRTRDGARFKRVATFRTQQPRVEYTREQLDEVDLTKDAELRQYLQDSGVYPATPTADTLDDTFEPYSRGDYTVQAKALGTWLGEHFCGYCYQRQHTLDRPLFAKLISGTGDGSKIDKLDAKAKERGFRNLSSEARPATDDKIEEAKYYYYRALRAAGSGRDQTGTRTRHLGRYYVVSLCPVAKFSARSYMQYGEWWGPTLEHRAIESQCCVKLNVVAAATNASRNREARTQLATYANFDQVFEAANRVEENSPKYLASRLLRLVQTTQALNEMYRDTGKNNRTSVAREDVKVAQDRAARAVLESVS
jgi:hypothetical protein